ncbi:MAG: TetR/AcrR family transcriptional regulator [Pseudomonadota bacterium]
MPRDADARARYIQIATNHFAARGFDGVSLALIAEDAGVSKQALLYFFKNKEGLYAEVLTDLTNRLLTVFEQVDADSPEQWLGDYFEGFTARGIANPTDAWLVLRALLDSPTHARTWPFRPYLDRLVAVAKQTDRWADAPDDQVLAELYHHIGSVLSFTVSLTALSGMYGEERCASLIERYIPLVTGSARARFARDAETEVEA